MESAGVWGQKLQKSVEDQENGCNTQLANYFVADVPHFHTS